MSVRCAVSNHQGVVSAARWSGPNSTDKRVEKAPFTVILAIVNVLKGCNKA